MLDLIENSREHKQMDEEEAHVVEEEVVLAEGGLETLPATGHAAEIDRREGNKV